MDPSAATLAGAALEVVVPALVAGGPVAGGVLLATLPLVAGGLLVLALAKGFAESEDRPWRSCVNLALAAAAAFCAADAWVVRETPDPIDGTRGRAEDLAPPTPEFTEAVEGPRAKAITSEAASTGNSRHV